MSKKTGIYVHIPFCYSKCAYCDFLSAAGSEKEIADYFKALSREIGSTSINEEVDSIFFGGGTPSLVHERYITEIIELLRRKYRINSDTEITIECNPGTLTEEKLAAYKTAGVNRLSIGLQSADDKELQMLGRIHTFDEFKGSFIMARKQGFDNISVDLMESVPGQTFETMMGTIEKVIALEPEHISAYSLILEEGTRMCEKREDFPDLPDEDTEREIYYAVKKKLAEAGYVQYEVSNFASIREGKLLYCRHNVGYWDRVNYYGFGLGAASLTDGTRYSNVRDMNIYIRAAGLSEYRAETELLDKEDQMSEFMFIGLRKNEGISSSVFKNSFGSTIEDVYGEILKEHIQDGTIKKTDVGYALTERGMDISNYILSDFL